MQIPKIFHYHSQYYVHYKSYKGREEERERVRVRVRHNEREIEIDWNSRAITKHNISKFPNSQYPTAEIQTQNDYLALKNGIHNTEIEWDITRERERERESWREIQPLQYAQHKHSEAICDYACWFVVFCASRFVVFLCKSMVMWWAMGKVRD